MSSDAAPRRKISVKAIGILAAVFVLGGAAGGAATWAVAVRRLDATMRHAPETARMKFRLEAMRRKLDLTDDQVQKLEAIFEKSGPEKQEALEGCKPKLEALRERVRSEVDAVLTEAQRTKHQEMRKHRRGHSGRRGRR